MLRLISNLLVALCVFSLTVSNVGCATLFTGGRPNQTVSFKSTPPGANVYVNNQLIGQTPIREGLARDTDHLIRIELAGYPKYEKQIKTGFNGWVLGNLVIGGLIGICIDLISGSTDSLNPASIHVNFEQLKSKAIQKPVTPTSPGVKPAPKK
jgi:PEGA domain